MSKLSLIWICERRQMGGGHMGETNSQSQGMQTCKWRCRKPSEVSLILTPTSRPAIEREKESSCCMQNPPKFEFSLLHWDPLLLSFNFQAKPQPFQLENSVKNPLHLTARVTAIQPAARAGGKSRFECLFSSFEFQIFTQASSAC